MDPVLPKITYLNYPPKERKALCSSHVLSKISIEDLDQSKVMYCGTRWRRTINMPINEDGVFYETTSIEFMVVEKIHVIAFMVGVFSESLLCGILILMEGSRSMDFVSMGKFQEKSVETILYFLC